MIGRDEGGTRGKRKGWRGFGSVLSTSQPAAYKDLESRRRQTDVLGLTGV